MKLERIDHVQLAMPAGEEGKARKFYSGLLGIPEVLQIREIRLQNKTPDVEASTILIGIIRRRFERIPLEFLRIPKGSVEDLFGILKNTKGILWDP